MARVHECDRRMDRQRDRFTMTKTMLCIASRGKNEMAKHKFWHAFTVPLSELPLPLFITYIKDHSHDLHTELLH